MQNKPIMGQLSHASGPTDVALIEQTIDTNFKHAVRNWPDREAIVVRHQNIRWNYRELDQQIERVARGLLAAGIEHGDRVALWSPNRVEWVLIQYATARIGAIMVCVNPAYRPVELGYVLKQSGARMIAAAPAFKTSDYKAQVAQVRQEIPTLTHAVFFGEQSWDELLAGGESIDAQAITDRAAALDNNDPINIQYTSGTTGLPKGATLTHRNILNNGYFVAEGCGYTHEDRVCIPVPLYHCFGMVMGNLGSTSPAPFLTFSETGSLGSKPVVNSSCVSLGELIKPGWPQIKVAQASPSASTLPATINGNCSKNSRCWSGIKGRIACRPIASICSRTPSFSCIAFSP